MLEINFESLKKVLIYLNTKIYLIRYEIEMKSIITNELEIEIEN